MAFPLLGVSIQIPMMHFIFNSCLICYSSWGTAERCHIKPVETSRNVIFLPSCKNGDPAEKRSEHNKTRRQWSINLFSFLCFPSHITFFKRKKNQNTNRTLTFKSSLSQVIFHNQSVSWLLLFRSNISFDSLRFFQGPYEVGFPRPPGSAEIKLLVISMRSPTICLCPSQDHS